VQVSTGLRFGSNASAQVLARGTSLDTDAPNFYSLGITNTSGSLQVRLDRVISGTATSLTTLSIAGPLLDTWMVATLKVEGAHLQVQIFRTDTGQFLSSGGVWQANQTDVFDLSDAAASAIRGGGVAGLGQTGGAPGGVSFDNFSVLNLPSPISILPNLVPGSLPADWSQYTSDPNTAFFVTKSGTQDQSAALVVASGRKGLSKATTRAWLTHALPANGQISADIALNSIPSQLLARGSQLDTSTPSYYALSLARGSPGPQALLTRVNGGISTVLGTLNLTRYVGGGTWVQETLVLNGNHLQAQFFSPDTNQYLNSAGNWQRGQAFAFDIVDTGSGALTAEGNAGIGRPASYVGTLTFAHFGVSVPSVVESFDGLPLGTMPAGWLQSRSDNVSGNPPTFAVASPPQGIVPLSGGHVLASTAPSGHVSAWTWNSTLQWSDVEVSAGIYVNSPTPVQLFARGNGLGTATPTYYALTLARGSLTRLQLQKVVNGVTVALPGAEVDFTYISKIWVQAALYVNGSSIRAQLYRSDTGQYLNDHGVWQTMPAWAINITDSGIKQSGVAGLFRGQGTVAPVYFDNFVVSPVTADVVPPTVSLKTPASSGVSSGIVTLTATASDDLRVTRVEFYVDNVLHAVTTAAPFSWAFDTSTVSNGVHTLVAKAFDAADNFAVSAPITLTTLNNTTIAPPSLPSHYSHIRIAELAYSGTPLDAAFTHLLASSVDLVIPNPVYLDTINAQSPSTPKLIYTNVSNIYRSLLTDWLTYADNHGIDREQAFYHVAAPTPFSGSSPSSQPVNQFWGIYRGGSTLTNLTSFAGSSQAGIAFGAANESLYLGYPDPFREINVNLATTNQGSNIVLQYAKAVDPNGNPIDWADVPLVKDTTAGLTSSGRITFDPPADWKTSSVNGSARLYYVRFLTKSVNGVIPVASSFRGRDYVGANGTTICRQLRSNALCHQCIQSEFPILGYYLRAATSCRQSVGKWTFH
jgi:hypothetical protein